MKKFYSYLHDARKEAEAEKTISKWQVWAWAPVGLRPKPTLACAAAQQGGREAGIPDPGTSGKF